MNGAAQVEPSPAPAHLLATDEPRAHDAGKTFGERLGLRDVGGIDDVAKVDAGEILGKETMPILSDDTPESLHARIQVSEHRLLPGVIAGIAEKYQRPEA